MSLAPLPIRLFCDLTARSNVLDLNTGQAPLFYRGDDIEIDIGIGENGVLLTGLTNIASITASIFQSENDTNAALMSATVNGGVLNVGLTNTEWVNNTSPYFFAAFVFPNAQTAISLGGAASVNYWLRIAATTSDTPAKVITLLDGPITIKDGPISGTTSAVVNGLKLVTDGGVPNVPALYDPATGHWYALEIDTEGGVRTLSLSDTAY